MRHLIEAASSEGQVPRGSAPGKATETTDEVRLESDTLYDVIAVIAASPDMDRVLSGVVGVLTTATRCHGCFVYLRSGDRLRLAAASPVYEHLVGQIEFGADQGLVGWVLRRNTPAFIRENAMEDPRMKYVPELHEERFQSIAAVSIPSRGGEAIGVIALQTVAPREFDDGTMNVLSHTASLVAGAIENAQLYEDSRRRVGALTSLIAFGERIAAVTSRHELYAIAAASVRAILRCTEVRLYEVCEDQGRLRLVAADPPREPPEERADTGALLPIDVLPRLREWPRTPDRETLGFAPEIERVVAAPAFAGNEYLGVVVAAGDDSMPSDAEELLRLVANQLAVAVQKVRLIEDLTEENVVRDLFEALETGMFGDAEARALQAGSDLQSPCLLVEAAPAREQPGGLPWPVLADRLVASLRRLAPGALCDDGPERLRARLPLSAGGSPRELHILSTALADLAADTGVVIGFSDVHRTVAAAQRGLHEARDAVRVALALEPRGGAMWYRNLGAYRYLVHVADAQAVTDPYLEAVRQLRDYDLRRGTQLTMTLEVYLAERGNITDTARRLIVHPNTLRQRLGRIESLTEMDLATADVLALALAVKFTHLTEQSP